MPTPKIQLLRDDEPLPEQALAQLARLEIRESDWDPALLALRFNLTQQPDGAFALLDDDTFEPGARLAAEIAAPGGLSQRLFDGWVSHVRPHFEEPEANSYLEVLAMDAALLLDAEERIATYPDALDSEAAEEILGRYQIAFDGVATAHRHQEDRRLLVQRGSDWQFLRRLARRNGYVCYFEHDPQRGEVVGHFAPRALDQEPQPDLTVLRQGANLAWIDLQLLTGGPVRHRGLAIDPLAKQLLRGEAEAEQELLGEDGLADAIEQGLVAGGAEQATALLRHPPPADAELDTLSRTASERDQFVVEARGELEPALYRGLLRARRPVLVKGVGRKFSGVYYVRSVRTTVDEGTLAQTFVAERNALGQSGRESFGQDAEEVPPQ